MASGGRLPSTLPISRRTVRPVAQKGGAFAQAIGISRGGRTSKLHGLTDAQGRSRLLIVSVGNINDMTTAAALIEAAAGRCDRLIADRGYDTNAVPSAISAQGAEVVIPSMTSRRAPTRPETSSNASGAASRTGAALPPDTTSSPEASSLQHISLRLHLLVQLSSNPRIAVGRCRETVTFQRARLKRQRLVLLNPP